jgi:hypothetical protein
MPVVYALRVIQAGAPGVLQDFNPQPQPFGAYAEGDEYFFGNQRYSIQKVAHGVTTRPDGSFLVGTMLTLGIPSVNLSGGDWVPWPW